MAIVEFHGGPITHRYLMNKSKHDLARMYMELLDVRAREAAIWKTALHDTIVSPKGVIPHTAAPFYDEQEADAAEARRPKLTPIGKPGW